MLDAIAEQLQKRLPDRLVAVAHLEIAPPDVAAAIDRLVAEGATDIVVHPYFLAPGRHAEQDVPEQARRAAARHPGLRLRVTEPLGVHAGMVETVLARLAAAGDEE